jgi:hypothetical protein
MTDMTFSRLRMLLSNFLTAVQLGERYGKR